MLYAIFTLKYDYSNYVFFNICGNFVLSSRQNLVSNRGTYIKSLFF